MYRKAIFIRYHLDWNYFRQVIKKSFYVKVLFDEKSLPCEDSLRGFIVRWQWSMFLLYKGACCVANPQQAPPSKGACCIAKTQKGSSQQRNLLHSKNPKRLLPAKEPVA